MSISRSLYCAAASALWVLFSAGLGLSEEQAAPTGPPVAIVGERSIYEADVAAILQSRRKTLPADPDEARQRALETLVAEIALEAQLDALDAASTADVAAAIADARRQILFEFYAQTQFDARPPTSDEIEAYIAANPAFFGDRSEYRFLRITARPRDDGDRTVVADLFGGLRDRSAVTEADLDGVALELARRGIPFTRELFWNGGEVLDPVTLGRIAGMQRDDTVIDIAETREAIDLIRLFETRAAPIDPTFLGAQIEDRVLLDRFGEFRAELVQALAAPHLETAPPREAPAPETPAPAVAPAPEERTAAPESAPEAEPRFDRASVGLAGLGVVGALATFGLVSARQWVRSAKAYAAELGNTGKRYEPIQFFDRTATALPLSAFALAALVAAVAVAAVLGRAALPAQPAAIFAGGGAILGLLAGIIHVRSRPLYVDRPVTFARQLLWTTLIQISMVAVLVSSG